MPRQVSLWERVSGEGRSQTLREIPDLYATVDDTVFPEVDRHRWYLQRGVRADGQPMVKFVATSHPGPVTPLQHFVLSLYGVPKPAWPLIVTFGDGNPLNNCRDNLIVITSTQKAARRAKFTRNSHGKAPTSEFKGVCWSEKSRKWLATARFDGTKYYLGMFPSEVDAAIAVNVFYATHRPTFPLPNPTVPGPFSDDLRCRCRSCRGTPVLV
jgi:hypothetical protein